MESVTEGLVRLGLTEYEARVYVALVGLGEANARRIHEESGVPRARVYDVLNTLGAKGCVVVRQGSPLMYAAVPPETVVAVLKRELDGAAGESLRALEALSADARQSFSPIWYVHGDRAVSRSLDLLAEKVRSELLVLCFDTEALQRFQETIRAVAADRSVKVLFPNGRAAGAVPIDGASLFEAGPMRDFFGTRIFGEVFSVPIDRGGAIFRLECILVADDRESMMVYSQNGRRMAVVITLPFITCVQSRLFGDMVSRARPVDAQEA